MQCGKERRLALRTAACEFGPWALGLCLVGYGSEGNIAGDAQGLGCSVQASHSAIVVP